MPFLPAIVPILAAVSAVGGLAAGVSAAVDTPESPPGPEDPRIAEARRRRQISETRGRGRASSRLSTLGGGSNAPTQAPSLLGGTR